MFEVNFEIKDLTDDRNIKKYFTLESEGGGEAQLEKDCKRDWALGKNVKKEDVVNMHDQAPSYFIPKILQYLLANFLTNSFGELDDEKNFNISPSTNENSDKDYFQRDDESDFPKIQESGIRS